MNETRASGFIEEAKGKIKQTFGEATNDQSVANSGTADQVKGSAEQTWGSVKDSASNLSGSHTAESTSTEAKTGAGNLRDKITGAAEHAKESIQHGLENLENKANK